MNSVGGPGLWARSFTPSYLFVPITCLHFDDRVRSLEGFAAVWWMSLPSIWHLGVGHLGLVILTLLQRTFLQEGWLSNLLEPMGHMVRPRFSPQGRDILKNLVGDMGQYHILKESLAVCSMGHYNKTKGRNGIGMPRNSFQRRDSTHTTQSLSLK